APHRHRAAFVLGDRRRPHGTARGLRDRRLLGELRARHRVLPGAQAAAVERRAHGECTARAPGGRTDGAGSRRASAAGSVPAPHSVRGNSPGHRAPRRRGGGIRPHGTRAVSQSVARPRVASDRHEPDGQAAAASRAGDARIRPEAGAVAAGAGPGLRGLPRVGSQLSIPPGGGRRSAADRATLASTGSRACVWPRTCSRPGALGHQRARGHGLVGREPRRAARSRRGDDALAAAARARGRGCSARRAAWHAGGRNHRPDPTMTLTTTTLGGETGGLPLLESGVIAVVRAPEAARVRAVAHALAAGGVGAVEITLTTPGAIALIADLARDDDLSGCVVGAGTVLDEAAARA